MRDKYYKIVGEPLITHTIELFQPLYGDPLSEEQAYEIIYNIIEYAKVLLDIEPSSPEELDPFSMGGQN